MRRWTTREQPRRRRPRAGRLPRSTPRGQHRCPAVLLEELLGGPEVSVRR
ncbi:hypothetical protein LT493_10095 [Streptomyces tricolor]|nr:hypothetical protein [Streptomyces tricolor]